MTSPSRTAEEELRMLATFVAGFLPRPQLQELIERMQEAGRDCGDGTDSKRCEELLRQGYKDWTGEKFMLIHYP